MNNNSNSKSKVQQRGVSITTSTVKAPTSQDIVGDPLPPPSPTASSPPSFEKSKHQGYTTALIDLRIFLLTIGGFATVLQSILLTALNESWDLCSDIEPCYEPQAWTNPRNPTLNTNACCCKSWGKARLFTARVVRASELIRHMTQSQPASSD